MKIGILTFHCADNYGAVMQCYALQEYLRSLGHDVYVIDYRPKYVVDRYAVVARRYWIVRSIKRTLVKYLTEPYLMCVRAKRHRALEAFVQNRFRLCPYSREMSGFDVIVMGSDQIWSPKLTGNHFDEVFFGSGFNCKKIAYAASNRSSSLSEEEVAFYKSHLAQIDFVGVRESTLQGLLQPLTDKPVHLNIDPTLLSDVRWTAQLDLKRPMAGDYVMLYEVSRHLENRNRCLEVARANNCSFAELTGSLALSFRRTTHLNQTASPEQFLSHIKYAKCVFTTSFHGTSLSILFQKDFFYCRQNTSADMRIESLLTKLGLTDRIIEKDVIPSLTPIDYLAVNERLKAFRAESVQYLENALSE